MIFTTNSDIYKNAYPNWQKSFRNFDEQFALYSVQFKESADKLINSVGENRGHVVDSIINPALFLYRHSIELCLKAILYKIYLNSGMSIDIIKEKLNGHNLESLWTRVNNEVRANYNFVKGQKEKNELKKIGQLILELHNTDDSSMTFRYPFNKDLEDYTYGNGKESFGIDFIHMQNEIDYIHSRLYYWIYERVSYKEEE
ncbi:hypothetical protein ACT3HK_15535 [Thermolongibacillus altinsuensis]|jgi:hypothetical protein